jgi:protein TonB
MPQIPDDLLQQSFKTHVLVRVIVHADGTGIPSLVTSSGNLEVDQLVLQALKQSTWKPALDSGKPIESSFRFRYEFSVQ